MKRLRSMEKSIENSHNDSVLPVDGASEAQRSRTPRGESAIFGETKHQPVLVTQQIVETDFAELQDGSLVEMIEDPALPSRTTFAVYKDGKVQYDHEVKTSNAMYVPLRGNSEIVRNVRLPRGVESYGSVQSLLTQIFWILNQCVEMDPMYTFLLANFVLCSWVIDRLTVAPYVAIVGLSGAGKTTLLRILDLLCRRSILIADVSSAAFYRVSDQICPTLLLDEADNIGQRRNLLRLLRVGSTPDFTVLRNGRSFKSYGARVISWAELPNDPDLNSRCIVVPLQESKRNDLKRTTDPEIQKACADVQKQLQQYRFDFHVLNSTKLLRVEGDERLHGHSRDLYEALALANGDEKLCKRLVEAFEILQEQNSEPLLPTYTAVLRTLFFLVHSSQYYDDQQLTSVGDLAGHVNFVLESRGERCRVTPREVGGILTTLSIPKRRCSWGFRVWLGRKEEKRIHDLVFRYGLDNSFKPSLLNSSSAYGFKIVRTYDNCECCRLLHRADLETTQMSETSFGVMDSRWAPSPVKTKDLSIPSSELSERCERTITI